MSMSEHSESNPIEQLIPMEHQIREEGGEHV